MSVAINYTLEDVSKKQWSFESLTALCEFVEGEQRYWGAVLEGLEQQHHNQTTPLRPVPHLQRAVQTLKQWLDNEEQYTEEVVARTLTQNNNPLQQINRCWLWSGHPATEVYKEILVDEGVQQAEVFYQIVFVNPNFGNISSAGPLFGAIRAYEFLTQGDEISNRRKKDKKSVSRIIDRLDKAANEQVELKDKINNELQAWRETTENSWAAWRKEASREQVDQMGAQKSAFDGLVDDSRTDLEHLKTTYEEFMRLKGPARYWKLASQRFGSQAMCFGVLLGVVAVVGIIVFACMFFSWSAGKQLGLNLGSLQGAVIFLSVASAYAFLVRALSKLTFSAMHLKRDAEERETLTHLYLSLARKTDVDEGSREIVLQALFSRADSGLLSGDSGPVMPGNIAPVVNAIAKK